MSRVALWLVAILCVFMAPASAELRDSYTPVTIVALGDIAEPENYFILSNATPADDAREISLDRAGRQASLADIVAGEDLHMGQELRTAIAAALLDKNLKVVPAAGGQKAHYRIDVAFPVHTVAYSDAPSDPELMPGFVALVMVHDLRTGEIRLRDRIVYGRTDIESAHTLDGDQRFHFASAEALLADPQSAADGLRAGIAAVAAEIAKIMSR